MRRRFDGFVGQDNSGRGVVKLGNGTVRGQCQLEDGNGNVLATTDLR